MTVNARIKGQTITWAGGEPAIVADSIGFVNFQFEFSEDWKAYDKVAQFKHNDKTYNQRLNDDSCVLPAEIKEGICSVSIFGYIAGASERGTTTELVFYVSPSGFDPDGETPVPPTPDLYAQLLSTISDEHIADAVCEYLTKNPPPKGDKGDPGEKGEKGDPGRDGVDGKDGKDGRDGTDLGAYVTPTASGSIASFDDGADDLPVKSLMVDIDPAQAGSGEPSPTNVRPISGWTGAKVTKAGLESDTTGIYNISFPAEAGTVYGGTLDVTNGVLTVDKAYYQFNGTETPGSMAEFTTVKRATFRLSALGLPDAMAMAGVSNSGKTGLFSHGKYLSAWSGTSADVPHGYADVSNLHTYLPFENANSDSVKAYFSSQAQNGTPVQIVYSLATPITYQLTPIEVKTMLGANNIWADTGDVSVSYRADPTLIYNKIMNAITNLSANLADADAALNEVGVI